MKYYTIAICISLTLLSTGSKAIPVPDEDFRSNWSSSIDSGEDSNLSAYDQPSYVTSGYFDGDEWPRSSLKSHPLSSFHASLDDDYNEDDDEEYLNQDEEESADDFAKVQDSLEQGDEFDTLEPSDKLEALHQELDDLCRKFPHRCSLDSVVAPARPIQMPTNWESNGYHRIMGSPKPMSWAPKVSYSKSSSYPAKQPRAQMRASTGSSMAYNLAI